MVTSIQITNTMQAHLLSLPPEIRYRIYELYFEDAEVRIRPAAIIIESARARKMHPTQQCDTQHKPHSHLALLQVCQQILREAEIFFYRETRFHVDLMSPQAIVPTEKLYSMRHLSGGAELRQLLELDEFRSSKRKKYSIMGPFEPDRIKADSLVIGISVSHPVMNYFVQEANWETQHQAIYGTCLSGLSHCVF